MTFAEVLMVDEIHVGSKDNSIIVDMWKEARRQGVRVPKLLMATATEFGLGPLMKELGGDVFRSDFRHYKVRGQCPPPLTPSLLAEIPWCCLSASYF